MLGGVQHDLDERGDGASCAEVAQGKCRASSQCGICLRVYHLGDQQSHRVRVRMVAQAREDLSLLGVVGLGIILEEVRHDVAVVDTPERLDDRLSDGGLGTVELRGQGGNDRGTAHVAQHTYRRRGRRLILQERRHRNRHALLVGHPAECPFDRFLHQRALLRLQHQHKVIDDVGPLHCGHRLDAARAHQPLLLQLLRQGLNLCVARRIVQLAQRGRARRAHRYVGMLVVELRRQRRDHLREPQTPQLHRRRKLFVTRRRVQLLDQLFGGATPRRARQNQHTAKRDRSLQHRPIPPPSNKPFDTVNYSTRRTPPQPAIGSSKPPTEGVSPRRFTDAAAQSPGKSAPGSRKSGPV